jgi:hypothetical protein
MHKKTIILIIMLVLITINGFAYAQDNDSSFDYYEIIEKRNFFRPKNETVESEIASSSAQPEKKQELDLALTGVIEIKSGYKAIVEKISTQKGFYVSQGDAIEDYTVKKIMLNKIVLEKDLQEFELKLQQGPQQKIKEPGNNAQPVQTEQKDIPDDQSANQNIRSNTMQQIRSGYRGKI